TYCPVPITGIPSIWGTATGYPANDSVNVHIYFGDGNDTSFWSPIDTASNYFFTSASRVYTSAGQFSIKWVITGTDGNADSIVNVDELTLADTCGNISGRVYLDNNSNCIFDAGDSILRGYPVELWSGANLIEWSMTDSTGMYYFSVP